MLKKSSSLLLLAVVAVLGLTQGEAQAARRKMRSPATSIAEATPRTFWASVSKAFRSLGVTKTRTSTVASVAPAPVAPDYVRVKPRVVEQVDEAPGAPPPRRPLGPVPIIVISPPKPVVSNP
jgi:hypothetical protein